MDTHLPSEGDSEIAPSPPFILTGEWTPPSKFAKYMTDGVVITIRLLPTAIVFWMFAPDELKYKMRAYSRWIPYAIRYATWWLNQKDF
jgi:hypothetical protein